MSGRTMLIGAGKIIASGLMALVILTLMCMLYENPPQHYTDKDGATDYRNGAKEFYSQWTEGIAWGRTNNEGYMNLFDYHVMSLDVLVIGSSHMEGRQIAMDELASHRLGVLLKRPVYNIGISGHSFPICADNLEAASRKYHPSHFIIMETSRIQFSGQELSDIINKSVPEVPSNEGGMLGFLRKNPYLRVIYHKLKSSFQKEIKKTNWEGENNNILLMEVLNKIQQAAASSGAKLIIAYHPEVALNQDGSLRVLSDPKITEQFAGLCEKTGIYFLDMGPRFLREYAENYTLPYGFCNTSVGKGHLNSDGHRMMADELFKLMKRLES